MYVQTIDPCARKHIAMRSNSTASPHSFLQRNPLDQQTNQLPQTPALQKARDHVAWRRRRTHGACPPGQRAGEEKLWTMTKASLVFFSSSSLSHVASGLAGRHTRTRTITRSSIQRQRRKDPGRDLLWPASFWVLR